jgi:hypothetical protein
MGDFKEEFRIYRMIGFSAKRHNLGRNVQPMTKNAGKLLLKCPFERLEIHDKGTAINIVKLADQTGSSMNLLMIYAMWMD